MSETLRRHEEEMCYVEREMKKRKGVQKRDMIKHYERMWRQRLAYLRYIDDGEKVEEQDQKRL